MPAATCQVQALLPAQLDGTIALRRLEHTTHPAQPTTADPHKRRSDTPLTRLAGPSRSPGRPVACSTPSAPCPAQPPWTTMVPGLHACWPLWALRSPDLRGRMAQPIAGEGLTGPHDGAQHQARNRVRRGLPLTEDNIATSPVDAPSICDGSLKATDQLVFVPMEHRELAARALERLLPTGQQTLVGTFPAPVEVLTTTLVNKETSS